LQQPIGEGELRSCGIQALVSKQAARDVGRWHSRSWNFGCGSWKIWVPLSLEQIAQIRIARGRDGPPFPLRGDAGSRDGGRSPKSWRV